MKQPTISITGAGGFVGQYLIDYFTGLGWEVRALVRDPARYSQRKNVRYISYDLTSPIPAGAFDGVDYLVHAAYIKSDRQHPDAYVDNVKGAQRLIGAAQNAGVRKTLFLSTMSSHEAAVSVYGKQKYAIEKLFAGKRAVVLRSGLIIGNGGIVKEMVGFLKTKRFVPLVDSGKQPLQIIAVNDLAVAIDHALTGNVHGSLTLANTHVYAYKELYVAVGKTIGVKIIFVPVPFWLLLAVLRIAAKLPLSLPVSEDNLWGLKMLRANDNADDMRKLGIDAVDLTAALKKSHL